MPISCEDAYIYRMYKRNPEANLDIKYLNKFGLNEFGKTNWSNVLGPDKKKKVKELIDKNFKKNMKQCGFTDFKQKLTTLLSAINQAGYLENHIKYELNLINNYTKFDIQNELSTFENKYNNLIKIFKDFKNSVGNSSIVCYYNIFNKYISDYINHITVLNDILSPVENLIASYKSLNNVIHVCDNTRSLYYTENDKKTILKVNDTNLDIITKINAHYKKLLENRNININDMMDYFGELYRYACVDINNVIVKTITNNNTIYNLTNEILMRSLKTIIIKHKLGNADTIQLLFNILSNKYEKLYNTMKDARSTAINFYELYSSNNFWQQVNVDNMAENASYIIMLKIFSEAAYNRIMHDKIIQNESWKSLHKGYNFNKESLALEMLLVSVVNKQVTIIQKSINNASNGENENDEKIQNEELPNINKEESSILNNTEKPSIPDIKCDPIHKKYMNYASAVKKR